MNQLTVKGTHYQCGYQIGKKYQNEIKQRLKIYNITKKKINQHQKQLEKILSNIQRKFNDYIEEIKGMADGSNITFQELFYLNCAELSQDHHGCSSIAQIDQKNIILAHNEDSSIKDKKQNTALIKFQLPHITFLSFTYLGELPANAYSWNQHGLYFSVNYIKAKNLNLHFIPRYFLTRGLIDCRSIKEAIVFLKKVKSSSAFHYFLGQKNKILSIEQLHDQLSIKEIKVTNFHTNHFIHDQFYNNAEVYTRSKEHYLQLERLIQTKDPLTCLFDKKNRPHAIYAREGDSSRTLSTVLFKPQQHKIEIYERDSKKSKKVFRL